jgi:hypothetical protein
MGDRILLSLFVRLLAPLDYVSFVACMQRA